MPSILFRFAIGLLKITNILRIKKVRNFFWNLRAADINKKWGSTDEDFETLKNIITKTKATRILDFGCGNGRLFPLFAALKIPEVTGQDVSAKAIKLAKEKHPYSNYKLLCNEVLELNYPDKHFDLIISNRSLSAIPPDEISATMDKLCGLGQYFYLNELSDLDSVSESPYWFKHDYEGAFRRNNFRLLDTGIFTERNEKWYLFGRTP